MGRVGGGLHGKKIELLCARCGGVVASLDRATVKDHGSHLKPTGGMVDTSRFDHPAIRCMLRQRRAARTAGRLPAPPGELAEVIWPGLGLAAPDATSGELER